mmetsp:Transcript_12276/g.40308  ORF Transcript_12276/g.40308 Transcript_12276/m.40308 type:complete len:175 (-) Transcript_12276:65-589(-)
MTKTSKASEAKEQRLAKPLKTSFLTPFKKDLLRKRMEGVLEIRSSSIKDAGKGVYACVDLPRGFQIPYLGRIACGAEAKSLWKGSDFSYLMQISDDRFDAKGARPLIRGDGRYSKSKFNFAYRINEARVKRDANVCICDSQKWAKMFSPMTLRTTRAIAAGDELFAWYNAGPWV